LAFEKQAGVKFTQVPFKGGSPAVQALVAGDVQLTFGTPPSVLPLMEAGRLRGIGVTSEECTPLLPDMPTIAEQGVPGYNQSFWFGLFAPAGTDAEIVQRLYAASVEALKDPDIQKRLAQQGNDVKWSASPAKFSDWVVKSGAAHATLARESGLEAE
jgi:tripartite-type tricarboxylate transporter receptor subunit TctC